MATTKKSTSTTTTPVNAKAAAEAVRQSLQVLVDQGLMSEEQRDKQLAQVETGMKAPARKNISEQIEDAVKKALAGKAMSEAFSILDKGSFSVTVLIKEGKLDTLRVTASNRKSTAGVGGKRAKPSVNGKMYASYQVLCDEYSLPVNGNSAKRVWERWHDTDPSTYPAVDEM